MVGWSRKNKVIAAVAAFAVYFALAAWSKWTWVDPVPKGRVVVRLDRPLEGRCRSLSSREPIPEEES